MTTPPDPYQSPAPPIDWDSGVSIEGSKLVVPDGYIFPPICPCTGETTGLGFAATRRVAAHEKWVYLLLLVGLLPYVLVAALISQRATFNCRLSPRVTRRWKLYRLLGGLAFLGSFFVLWMMLRHYHPLLALLSLTMLVGGLCAACGLFDGLGAAAIRNGTIWLSGIPRHVREKIVDIEYRRIEASYRAALAQQAQAQSQALQAGAAAATPVPLAMPPLPVTGAVPRLFPPPLAVPREAL